MQNYRVGVTFQEMERSVANLDKGIKVHHPLVKRVEV